MGILKVKNNWFGERCFPLKAISLEGITYDRETEMLIRIMYFKMSNS